MRIRFRRPLRRLFSPGVPPLLRRSHDLLAAGKYAEAATGLEQLAHAAEARGGRRAPALYIQAGRAEAFAGNSTNALALLERGLSLLATRGTTHKLAAVSNRLLEELNERGLHKEASKLADYLKNLNLGIDVSTASLSRTSRPPLPTHCPGCGAPVRSDEVEWLDDITAECEFCGSPMRGSQAG